MEMDSTAKTHHEKSIENNTTTPNVSSTSIIFFTLQTEKIIIDMNYIDTE